MSSRYPDIEKTVQEYALGKLSEAEAEKFEEYFLGRAEIVEMLEVAQNIHLVMRTTKRLDRPVAVEARASFTNRIFRMISIPVPAYAVAAMLVTIMVGPLLMSKFEPAKLADFELARFSSEATRSLSNKLIIDFSEYDKSVGIFVKLRSVDYPYYTLRLRDVEEDTVAWESATFEVSSMRDALIFVPKKAVAGKNIVEVIAVSDNGDEVYVEFCNYSERCV